MTEQPSQDLVAPAFQQQADGIVGRQARQGTIVAVKPIDDLSQPFIGERREMNANFCLDAGRHPVQRAIGATRSTS
jgi:hypothetical protein